MTPRATVRVGRRGLLVGAALGVAATSAARASDPTDFAVAVTDQRTNRVVVMRRDAWSEPSRLRSWSAGSGAGWFNLTDVRLRRAWGFGTVAVVAASGGNVGVYDVTGTRDQGLADLLWSASPGGNPHAAERVPGTGCVVSASSEDGGYLTLFAPRDVRRPETLAPVQQLPFPCAHGVLWDPNRTVLWAIGSGELRSYTVSGTRRDARLTRTARTLRFDGIGHDLQPDFADPRKLLITHSGGAHEVDVATLTTRTLMTGPGFKSLSRHASGEYLWTRSDLTSGRTWTTPTVRFTSGTRSRPGDEIYKARIFTSAYS